MELKGYISIIVIIFIFFIALLSGCSEMGSYKNLEFYNPPVTTSNGVHIYWIPDQTNATNITIKCDFYIRNPNERSIKVEDLKIAAFCNDEFIYIENIVCPPLENDDNHITSKDFIIYPDSVTEKTWSDIINGTGDWYILGKLDAFGLGDNICFSYSYSYYYDPYTREYIC
jgi:hypothetical protein